MNFKIIKTSVGKPLILITTIVFLYNSFNSTNSLIQYAIMLILIGLCIVFNQRSGFLNAGFFYYLYYCYVLALGPLFFLYEKLYLNFNYYSYILGGLLCFAWGITTADKFGFTPKRKIRFKFNKIKIERVNILRLLWFISILAGIYFAYKNRNYLFSGDIENGRVSAMAGNGMLIQLSQLSTVTIPMMYEVYHDGPLLYKKKYSSKIELLCMITLTFIVLLMQGYRSYAMTVGLCLFIVYISKNNISIQKMFLGGICGVLILEFLGIVRSSLSSSTEKLMSPYESLRNSLVVNTSNLGHVIATFPFKVPFQEGHTYLMNLGLLKPGPGIDFTLWLKQQVGIAFAGGGRTPSIIGESYLNFGTAFIFISMFLYGVIAVVINRYFYRSNFSFFSVYLLWQFAHSASGGIANVILPVMINAIIYIFIKQFPICLRKENSYESEFKY